MLLPEILDQEKIKRGRLIATVLNLKTNPAYYGDDDNNVRYDTTWGTKTALGLYETVKRIIEEGK